MKTQKQYYQQYVNLIKALNPIAIPDAPATDWWVKAQGIGGIASGIDQDIYTFRQNIFPQYASGNALDKFLASYNLAPRSSGTPATGYCSLLATQTQDITLPANTKLSISNNQYFIQQTTIVKAGTLGQIPIQSTNVGSGQQLANGTQLSLTNPINGISTLVVLSMNDGAAVESDANVRYRILQAMQNPKLGGTKEDYISWAMSQPNITNAYILANILQQGILSVFTLSGTSNPDTILSNPNVIYNRTTTLVDIARVQNYIETQRPINDNVLVSTTDTQVFTDANTINIGVVLVPNLTLDTLLPNLNNMSVANLIKREVRRAFISTPLYGIAIANSNYVLLSDIAQAIDSGLSVSTGIYAPILIDRTIDYQGTQNNIPINMSIQQDNNLFLVYDITYAAINVYLMESSSYG